MNVLGPDVYRLAITALLMMLLVVGGGIGMLMAVPLAGCAAYRARSSSRTHAPHR